MRLLRTSESTALILDAVSLDSILEPSPCISTGEVLAAMARQ